MDGQVDGWEDEGWMGGWRMDGRMDECIGVYTALQREIRRHPHKKKESDEKSIFSPHLDS